MAEASVLFLDETDHFASEIIAVELEKVGSKEWWLQHERIEKLCMQAVVNATQKTDEFVKEFLIQHDKLKVLIFDLITSELWSEKIYPRVKKELKSTDSTIPIYVALFHSTSLCGLLEVCMFYEEACEAVGDSIVDLIDYINRKITKLLLRPKDGEVTREEDELGYQYQTIEFSLTMKCLSIMKNICDSLEKIPLSAVTRILNIHDFPCLLCQVLDASPWRETDKDGNCQKFDGRSWRKVKPDEVQIITKIEGQVWLALYQLLLHPETRRKYEFTNYRKTQILKMRRYLNEFLVDQIPILTELQRYLDFISVADVAAYKQDLIIEQVPEVYDSLLQKYERKWDCIAKNQTTEYFIVGDKEMQEQAQRLAATYNLDILETLIDEPPVCVHCRSQAMNRCSRCRNEWYCSRPCQVKHWPKHKELCNLLAKTT